MVSSAPPVARIVDGIRDDPTVTRVDAVAQRYGIGVRRLQRLFTNYVGIGPKWVIRCLHEAAGRAVSGAPVDWAEPSGTCSDVAAAEWAKKVDAAEAADADMASRPHVVGPERA